MCFCALLQPSSLCALCVSVPFWQSVCPVCFSALLTVCVPCVFQCPSDSLCALCVSVPFWQSVCPVCFSALLTVCVHCVFQCTSDSLCVSVHFWQSSYLCTLCVSVPFWHSLCALCVSVPFWQSVCLLCFSALMTVFLFVWPVCFSALLTVFLFVCPVCFSALMTVFLFVCPLCFSALLTVFSLCVPCVFQCPSDSLPLCGQSVHLGGFSGGIHLHTRSELCVHAHYWKACLGCFCCFHNPTNSDMDYKIFKVCIWFFCRHICVHVTPLWWICTQKKKTWIIKLANSFCFTPL